MSNGYFALIASTIVFSAAVWGQDNTPATSNPLIQFQSSSSLQQYGPAEYGRPMNRSRGKKDELLEKLESLKKKLTEAMDIADDEQSEKVTAELEAVIGELFEKDLRHREQQIEQLEKRIAKSEAQLDKRQSARNELVDLQVRSFMYDAEGLGLSTNATASAGRRASAYRGNGYVPTLANAYGRQKEVPDPREEFMEQIRSAQGSLATSEDADGEKKALHALKSALGDYFDADMKVRRSELDSVKKELAEMEARLEKRAQAKKSIIELHVQMIVNEAKGLGFFSKTDVPTSGRYGNIYTPATGNQ